MSTSRSRNKRRRPRSRSHRKNWDRMRVGYLDRIIGSTGSLIPYILLSCRFSAKLALRRCRLDFKALACESSNFELQPSHQEYLGIGCGSPAPCEDMPD